MEMTARGDWHEGDYVLGQTEREAERLRRQAEANERYVETMLDQIGLAPGMACLDVGSGTGAAMELMGRRVGRTGKVVGLDINGEQGREVAAQLNQGKTSEYMFVEGDVNSIDTLPTEHFDVTLACLLLLHLRDPIAVIRRMWSWTRKGGCMAVIDTDCRSIDSFPPSPLVEEGRRVFYEVFKRSGRDAEIGCKLPAYVDRACGGPPSRTNVWLYSCPLVEYRDAGVEFYRSLIPAAIELAVTTPENVEAYLAEADRSLEDDGYFIGGLTVGTWKRKE
jgi:ubiquinone/menaquinone biosynthesis C-methylase UbiE